MIENLLIIREALDPAPALKQNKINPHKIKTNEQTKTLHYHNFKKKFTYE